MTDSAIRTLVNRFVTDLESLVRQAAFDSIAASLGVSAGKSAKAAAPAATAAPAKRKPGRPPASASAAAPAAKAAAKPAKAAKAKSGGRGRRSAKDIDAMAKQIHAFVKSNPGKRAEHIKSALKIPANHWSLPIAKLLSTKQLTTKGEKRATEYFAK
jgi:hypothetical protein